ncbi:MAG: hypothetical protein JNK27_16135 [Chitinophagaceae bacterium]|nr:hypothetical protein [Chitinophagaceae bacterium]
MARKFITIPFLFLFLNFVVGQTPQSIENINLCKQLKLKSIRTSRITYSEWASSPEGKVSVTDTSISFRLFDTSGRLVREYAGSGTNYLRNIYYDTSGRIDHEVWLWSKLQMYPKSIKPKTDSDYSDIYKKIKYHYNKIGRLDSSIIENGKKTIYQYNDSGYLISELEIEPSGFVNSFQITKYGYGVNWGKLLYKVSNYYTQTVTYEYEYQNRLLVKRKIIYDDGKKSTTYYNDKEQETFEELFDNDNKLVAKFEYKYNQYGIEKITSYRLPFYNSWNEARTNKLRISEKEIYKYEAY